jgi:hypothetical protein
MAGRKIVRRELVVGLCGVAHGTVRVGRHGAEWLTGTTIARGSGVRRTVWRGALIPAALMRRLPAVDGILAKGVVGTPALSAGGDR